MLKRKKRWKLVPRLALSASDLFCAWPAKPAASWVTAHLHGYPEANNITQSLYLKSYAGFSWWHQYISSMIWAHQYMSSGQCWGYPNWPLGGSPSCVPLVDAAACCRDGSGLCKSVYGSEHFLFLLVTFVVKNSQLHFRATDWKASITESFHWFSIGFRSGIWLGHYEKLKSFDATFSCYENSNIIDNIWCLEIGLLSL